MIVPLYKGKGESVVGITYARILVGRVCKVSKGLNDDEQRGGWSDQIFTLKHRYKKVQEKKIMIGLIKEVILINRIKQKHISKGGESDNTVYR